LIVKSEPSAAVRDFRRARNRANLQEIVASLTGRPATLLAYPEVREKLGGKESTERRLEKIPLDSIVGSVGRYHDFTRSFLPRLDSAEERWTEARETLISPGPVRPIEVYRIDQVHFVLDGNHRVSVARQLGHTHIWAHVIDIETKVSLSPDVDPEALILKAEYTDFLEQTHLDDLRPAADLSVTVAGQYQVLKEQIIEHQLRLDLERKTDTPYHEAVAHWYDQVYLPVVRVIRRDNVLRYFPGRTETDLYAWVSEHRARLKAELGWEIEPETATADLAARFSPRPDRVAARVSERIIDAVTPDEVEAGPPPGQWRRERSAIRQPGRMFADILVAVDGDEAGWCAVDHALFAARHEGARLHGLHVVPSEDDIDRASARSLRAEFARRCAEAGVVGELNLEVGQVPREVCARARWTDLVVLSLSHPPAPRPIARLGSGLSTIIRRCPRPVLAVPQGAPSLQRALLAYDGSLKSEEALYVATYLSTRWEIPLVVLTVLEMGRTTSETLEHARRYITRRGGEAAFVKGYGPVAAEVIRIARARRCDLIIMGGYGFDPVREIVLGSEVDKVLRKSRRPVLICR